MNALKSPNISLLSETDLDPNSYHSILISLFRGLAALEVAAAHVRAQTMPSLRSLADPNIWYQGLAFFTGFAHQAVVIFFLISGWLVGGSLLNKLNKSDVMLSYCLDRVTRLWLVLIPSFLATIVFGLITRQIDPAKFDHAIDNEYSTTTFLGNLFGMQDLLVPRFGGNFSLWSLTYETWYYVLFPLALLAFVARKMTGRVIAAAAVAILASHLSVAILLYSSVWMLGAVFSRIRIDIDHLSRSLLLAIFIVVAVYFRLYGSNNVLIEKSYLQDLLYSLIFLVLLSSQRWGADLGSPKVRVFKAAGQFLSKFSFTLYVIHVPFLALLKHLAESMFGIGELSPERPAHFAIYFLMLAAIVLFSYLFYLPFEAQTHKLRQYLRRAFLNRPSRVAGINPSSEAQL
jgi:peptidoglycan/LPS O-acetylase OafA/YrhL